MDSPPSVSIHSEAPVASEDSGLVVNSGSFSSDSASGWRRVTSLPDDDKSLISDSGECSDSSDTSSEINFNTIRKRLSSKDRELMDSRVFHAIDPPNQGKSKKDDKSSMPFTHPVNIVSVINASDNKGPVDLPMSIRYSTTVFKPIAQHGAACNVPSHKLPKKPKKSHSFTPPMLSLLDLSATPDNDIRPACFPRLWSPLSSENSLTKDSNDELDDANIIAEMVSVDDPVDKKMSEVYTVPSASDIYSVPVDSLPLDVNNIDRPKTRFVQKPKRRGSKPFRCYNESCLNKAFSLPGPSTSNNEPIDSGNLHKNVKDMRKYLSELQISSSDSDVDRERPRRAIRSKSPIAIISNGKEEIFEQPIEFENKGKDGKTTTTLKTFSVGLKKSFCNLFRWRKTENRAPVVMPPAIASRALPPLPVSPAPRRETAQKAAFASSIEQVKDCGWYWGPISVAEAEKILFKEPDGSFIVRDSSDNHYIFTLTFKLHGMRHVRIEQDHGNFCFGGCTNFKSQTIVEFIENAVETSRSGKYLFFLNLRPVQGPVRVQLLHPVSRFAHIQSLQHMCRYVILKQVRRDLVPKLPLPRRLLDYMNAPQYVTEF